MSKFSRLALFKSYHRDRAQRHRRVVERIGSSVDQAVRHDFYMERLMKMVHQKERQHAKQYPGMTKAADEQYHRILMETVFATHKHITL